MGNSSPALRLGHIAARQLALRTSVSSTSVTLITPGAGCSITSTATVSTTGATGCLIHRAAFFTAAARLDLALATVFAAEALPALARLAGFLLGSFPRFWAFDCFLRLAMIVPLFWLALCAKHSVGSKRGATKSRQPIEGVINRSQRTVKVSGMPPDYASLRSRERAALAVGQLRPYRISICGAFLFGDQLASCHVAGGSSPSSAPSDNRTRSRSPSIARRNTARASSSGFTVLLADRLERPPRFVESRLQKHQRLRIKGVVVEAAHAPPPT